MFKKRIWFGIILSIILMVSSVNGFTAYYKYTQESGTNFYVGTDDKADALEDSNEVRQILDDLGNLLGHSKRDDLYPKDETTGGYLGRLNYGLDASKPAVPVVNDMYLATDTTKVYRCFVAGNWVEVYPDLITFLELTDTPAAYDNGKYAKSTADGVIWDTPAGAGDMSKVTYDSDEDGDIDVAAGGTEKSSWTLYAIPYLSLTTAFGEIPIGTVGQVLKVAAGATGYEFAIEEVTKTGDFTAGRIVKINNATGIIEQGTNTDTDVADAVTKKHTQNTDTQFDFYNALADTYTWSGDKDTQLVGESVVFGDLLYFNWTDKEWKKTDADAATTMPGLRIALEAKNDGEACLMLVKGYIRDDSLFEFAGSMIYASVTPGAMSSTAPTETGDQIQRVGVAKSADILFFDPSIDVGEI